MDAEEYVDDPGPDVDPDVMESVTAVILAGGRGTRMDPDSKAKAVTDIGGKPLIKRLIEHLNYHGIKKIHVCLGYRWSEVKSALFGVEGVSFSNAGDDMPMGERLSMAYESIDTPRVLVCYGDTLADVDLRGMTERFYASEAAMSLTVHQLKSEFGIAEIDDEQVTEVREKPRLPHWMSIGYLACQAWVFLKLSSQDTLVDWVNRIAKEDRVIPHFHKGFHYTVNTERDRVEVDKIFRGV